MSRLDDIKKLKLDSEPEGIRGTLSDAINKNIIKYDTVFKSVFKYRGMAALLLKYTVRELKDYSVDEIIKFIVDDRDIKFENLEQAFEYEMDLRSSEEGDLHDKNIRYDLKFNIRIPGDVKDTTILITIDLEMQKEYETKYPMVSRMIYYLSSLLRSTLKGSEDYTHLNKVYSIWLCANNEVNLRDFEKNTWFHRYNMLRCLYEDESAEVYGGKSIYSYDKDADLMSGVLIELNKINKEQCPEFFDILNCLFNQTNVEKTFDMIQRHTTVNLTKARKMKKGVSDMYTQEQIREAYTESGRAEGIAEGIAKGRAEEREEAIKKLVEFGISKDNMIRLGYTIEEINKALNK